MKKKAFLMKILILIMEGDFKICSISKSVIYFSFSFCSITERRTATKIERPDGAWTVFYGTHHHQTPNIQENETEITHTIIYRLQKLHNKRDGDKQV